MKGAAKETIFLLRGQLKKKCAVAPKIRIFSTMSEFSIGRGMFIIVWLVIYKNWNIGNRTYSITSYTRIIVIYLFDGRKRFAHIYMNLTRVRNQHNNKNFLVMMRSLYLRFLLRCIYKIFVEKVGSELLQHKFKTAWLVLTCSRGRMSATEAGVAPTVQYEILSLRSTNKTASWTQRNPVCFEFKYRLRFLLSILKSYIARNVFLMPHWL